MIILRGYCTDLKTSVKGSSTQLQLQGFMVAANHLGSSTIEEFSSSATKGGGVSSSTTRDKVAANLSGCSSLVTPLSECETKPEVCSPGTGLGDSSSPWRIGFSSPLLVYLPPEGRAGTPNGKSRRRQPGCQCAAETQPLESYLHRFEPTISFKATAALKYLHKE